MNRLKDLEACGQAVWLDYIHREMLEDGELAALVRDDGLTGVTSNPAIFQQAISGSPAYDQEVARVLAERPEVSTEALYEALAVHDVQAAADVLAPVYESTDGRDGYVSLEVSPHLAADTEGTIHDAMRLWKRVDRPNLMIKVPATAEGLPAVTALLAAGINVNITLMFSLAHYESVAQAYLAGLAEAAAPARLASVASFFVSRVDSMVDPMLSSSPDPAAASLAGRVAIANSKLAYARFRQIFGGAEFDRFRERGCRPQRVLWASTSTKNPAYRDVLYVEELIGPETVNTMPPATLKAFRDHGEVRPSLTQGLAQARQDLESLDEVGVDLGEVTETLQRQGVEKFVRPYDALLEALETKRSDLASKLRQEA